MTQTYNINLIIKMHVMLIFVIYLSESLATIHLITSLNSKRGDKNIRVTYVSGEESINLVANFTISTCSTVRTVRHIRIIL